MPPQNPRILLVDNNPIALEGFKGVLENAKKNYIVISTDNLDNADNLANEFKFDLVITDIRLRDDGNENDLSGFKFGCEMIRRRVPTILMTKVPDFRVVRSRLNSVFPDTLSTPMNFFGKSEPAEDLVKLVEQTLRGRNVFIVHGRDITARERVELCVHNMGLYPVVLQNEPGYTEPIYNKLEAYSNVAFVIVLMTPDDTGGLQAPDLELHPRARQNVIYELGYFMGKYGKRHIAVLMSEHVDLFKGFSDFYGVEYISFDKADKWKQTLYQRIKATGLEVRMPK